MSTNPGFEQLDLGPDPEPSPRSAIENRLAGAEPSGTEQDNPTQKLFDEAQKEHEQELLAKLTAREGPNGFVVEVGEPGSGRMETGWKVRGIAPREQPSQEPMVIVEQPPTALNPQGKTRTIPLVNLIEWQ